MEGDSNTNKKRLTKENEKHDMRGSAKDEEMMDVLLESNRVEFQREKPTKGMLAQMVAPPSQLKTLIALKGPIQLAKDLGNDDPINVGIVTKGFDFEEQKKEYGSNYVPPPPAPSYLLLVWDGLQDLTLLMLLIAGIVGLILGLGFEKDKSTAWVEGAAILLAVAVVLNVQAATDYSKTSAFRKQQIELENRQSVICKRDGIEHSMHPREVVVGDVIRVKTGDVVAADGVLISGHAKMDESALTGESKVINKLLYDKCLLAPVSHKEKEIAPSPFILSGTNAMDADGYILVVAVGENSVQGRILSMVAGVEHHEDEVSICQSCWVGCTSCSCCLVPEEENHLKHDAEVHSKDLESQPTASIASNVENKHVEDTPLARRKRKYYKPRQYPRVCMIGCWHCGQSWFSFGKIPQGGSLAEKLDVLALDIGKAGTTVALLIFVILIMRWSIESFAQDKPCYGWNNNATACVLNSNFGCSYSNSSNQCERSWRGAEDIQTILAFFITSLTILVVAVPEGLPLAVTLSLSIAMRRMQKDNNQVKLMEASETMGSATTICSDKTGTLTMNRMTVVRCVPSSRMNEPAQTRTGGGEKSLGVVLMEKTKQNEKENIQRLLECIALSSDASSKVELKKDGGALVAAAGDSDAKYVQSGNATECALLKLVLEMGSDPEAIRASYKIKGDQSGIQWGVKAIAFSSTRKRSSWIVKLPNGQFRLFAKGAPNYIFDACKTYLETNANALPFTEEVRKLAEKHIDDFMFGAMRTIALAYRDFSVEPSAGWDARLVAEDETSPYVCESDLTLIGLIGIEDPLRPNVTAAIATCYQAGVDVRMVTGDALPTAIAIATQCGILRERDLEIGSDGRKKPKANFAMTGAEFDERVHLVDTTKPKVLRRAFNKVTGKQEDALAFPFKRDARGEKILNQKNFDEIWPKLRVIARCLPEDKLTLVKGLKKSKVFMRKDYCNELLTEFGIKIFPDYQVVAVTGDGTNDAPALKKADVGFAMGIVGTPIAQQACDILLMDDNFASIIAAVKWGRNVFDSISKFIQFQLTVNVVAILTASVGALVFEASPLSAIQMLWVNMIMDSIASIALATESPKPELLQRAPYGKRRPIISRVMAFNILGNSMLQFSVMMAILFDPSWLPGNVEKYPPNNENFDIHQRKGSVHWTILFNTFVCMQIVNFCNMRHLQTVERLKTTWREWNVFFGITSNPIFFVILVLISIIQACIVQFAGPTFKVVPLSAQQWAFSIGWALAELPFQILINVALVVTDNWFTKRQHDLVDLEESKGEDDDEEMAVKGANDPDVQMVELKPEEPAPIPINEARKFVSREINPSKRDLIQEEEKRKELIQEIVLEGYMHTEAAIIGSNKSSNRSDKSGSKRGDSRRG